MLVYRGTQKVFVELNIDLRITVYVLVNAKKQKLKLIKVLTVFLITVQKKI